VRENQEGTLYSLVFANPVSQNLDRIEKKPLFHFYPGSLTYSLATRGCNFHCAYCTNWQISQVSGDSDLSSDVTTSPEQVVDAALTQGCSSIAYTYVEPTIFWEYIQAIAPLAQSAGLFNVFKTNGFFSPEMLEVAHPYLNAANVDLKAFQEKTYQAWGGRLKPVLDSLKSLQALGVWLELSTVIIPGVNDGKTELAEMASFIATELGEATPWHLSRFFPAYKMERVPATPNSTLYQARDLARAAGLKYVYLQNFLGEGNQDTFCPRCGQGVIKRSGFSLVENSLVLGCCPSCGEKIAGCGLAQNVTQGST
jgi:pyruvate formate lyase activating enzyme